MPTNLKNLMCSELILLEGLGWKVSPVAEVSKRT
jgi:hypothetical protein